MVGCSENEYFEDSVRKVTISAEFEKPDATRSLALEGGGFAWSTGDAIGVYTTSGKFREFTLENGGGSSSANFTGFYIGSETSTTCAAYPYNDNHTVSGNTLNFHMPASYGSFEDDYTPNTNAPMVARFDTNGSNSFSFRHIGGVFRFTLNNVPKDAAMFTFTATDKDITGSFEVDMSSTESPYIIAKDKSSANSVTINFKPLTEVKNGMVFYVPLPTGTYNGFTLSMHKQDGTKLVGFTSKATNTLSRCDLTKFPELTFADVDGSIEEEEEAGTLVNGVAKLASAGTLATVLDDQMLTLTSLKVIGEINGTDVRCLRQMLGLAASYNPSSSPASTTYGESGVLSELDLSEAIIVEGGESYFEYDGTSYDTENYMIGAYMFSDPYTKEHSLTSIKMPTNTKAIGDCAFMDCLSLKSVTIPEEVKIIADGVFAFCSSLQSVTIPKRVTSIGVSAFYGCSSLQSVTIPVRVTTIEYNAFYGCSSLLSVTIPEGVTTIKSGTFQNCTELQSVTIPEGVTKIEFSAFDGCSSLLSVTIPEGVTTIEDYTFRNCSSLQSVTIPKSVTTIESSTFSGCSSLQSVTIPEGVTTIGMYAFEYCSNLQSVTIPEGVTTIRVSAFYGCSSLLSITIPESITTIEDYVFYECSSLTEITCKSTVPPTLDGSHMFRACASNARIYVPIESIDTYKTATGWSEYADMIVGMEE